MKKAIPHILFTVTIISSLYVLGTIGGFETNTLTIKEFIIHMIASTATTAVSGYFACSTYKKYCYKDFCDNILND